MAWIPTTKSEKFCLTFSLPISTAVQCPGSGILCASDKAYSCILIALFRRNVLFPSSQSKSFQLSRWRQLSQSRTHSVDIFRVWLSGHNFLLRRWLRMAYKISYGSNGILNSVQLIHMQRILDWLQYAQTNVILKNVKISMSNNSGFMGDFKCMMTRTDRRRDALTPYDPDRSREWNSINSKAIPVHVVRCRCYWRYRPTISWSRLKAEVSGQPQCPSALQSGIETPISIQ